MVYTHLLYVPSRASCFGLYIFSLCHKEVAFYCVRSCLGLGFFFFNWSQTSHKAPLLANKHSLSWILWGTLRNYQCWDLCIATEHKKIPIQIPDAAWLREDWVTQLNTQMHLDCPSCPVLCQSLGTWILLLYVDPKNSSQLLFTLRGKDFLTRHLKHEFCLITVSPHKQIALHGLSKTKYVPIKSHVVSLDISWTTNLNHKGGKKISKNN